PGDPGRVRPRSPRPARGCGRRGLVSRVADRALDRSARRGRAADFGLGSSLRVHPEEEHMRYGLTLLSLLTLLVALAAAGSAGANRHAATFTYCTDPTF